MGSDFKEGEGVGTECFLARTDMDHFEGPSLRNGFRYGKFIRTE